MSVHVCKEITSLDELKDMYDGDIPYVNDYKVLWCYQIAIQETEVLPDEISVSDFLSLVGNKFTNNILMYSVNTNEQRWEEWVQVAKDLEPIGATVTMLDRGDRHVFLCCIPTTFSLENE